MIRCGELETALRALPLVQGRLEVAVQDVVLARLGGTAGRVCIAAAIRLSLAQALGLRWLTGRLGASPTDILHVLVVCEHSDGDLEVRYI